MAITLCFFFVEEVLRGATGMPRAVVDLLVQRGLRPVILELGLSDEHELTELDVEVRRHLADPYTVSLMHLLVVTWVRKPSR